MPNIQAEPQNTTGIPRQKRSKMPFLDKTTNSFLNQAASNLPPFGMNPFSF
jgi:hypothetical protein